jgi:hypothetical protein
LPVILAGEVGTGCQTRGCGAVDHLNNLTGTLADT